MAYLRGRAGGGIRRWPPGVAHANFYEKSSECVDVWCEALCCRHINFETVFYECIRTRIFWGGGTASSPSGTPSVPTVGPLTTMLMIIARPDPIQLNSTQLASAVTTADRALWLLNSNCWNSLPNDVRSASSVCVFKCLLSKCDFTFDLVCTTA